MIPIFIGGCGRSGTTLLGALLGAHSECLTVPESQFIIDVLRSCGGNAAKIDVRSAFEKIQRHVRFKIWRLHLENSSIADENLGNSYPRLIEWIIGKYGEQQGKPSSRIWIDHTGANTMYAATLFELFPEARMIHIVRDGRAVAASIMLLDWGPNTIVDAAKWWMKKLSHGLAAESYFGPNRVIRVRYEDLILEPESTLRGLCQFISIQFEPDMLKGGSFHVPEYTKSQHALVGQEPEASRVNAWRQDLTHRQIEIFECYTGDLLHYLGYPLMFGVRARKPSRREWLTEKLTARLLGGIKTFHHRRRLRQNTE